ncbi:MAG: hypothetical protein ACOX1P_22475 [Thermoguttaceae bacterium]
MQSQPATTYFDALAALDLQHDELLRQLEQLDRRIEQVLQDNQPPRTACTLFRRAGRASSPGARRDLPEPPLTGGGPDDPTC